MEISYFIGALVPAGEQEAELDENGQ